MSDIVEDLEVQVSTAASSKEKVDLLNKLAAELIQRSESNLPKAVALLEWAQALLHEVNDPLTSASVYDALGATYTRMGDERDAVEHYNRALTIYRSLGRLDKGSQVLRDLSQLYLGLGENEKALGILQESLDLARQSRALDAQAATLLKLASLYFTQADYPLAQESCQNSRQLYRDAGDARGEAEAQVLLGDILMALGEQSRAADCYQAGFKLAQKSEHQRLAVEALLKLGEFYRSTGQPGEALSYLRNASELAALIGHKRFQYESHRGLALVYRQLGDFEKAFLHFEQFYQLKEETALLEEQEHQRNIEKLAELDGVGRDAEIYHLKNVILQEEIRKRQEMEHALTQANQQLREEVASRELLIDDLDSFASMVAHDLKNPLTNIALTMGVLRMSVTLANDKVGAEAADRLTHQVEKINRIINELLVLASVRKEDIYTEPLDMEEIINEVEMRLERLVKEKHPDIRKPSAWPCASGHAPWVEEIWENYISNAIHYGGRPPIVEIGADKPKDGMVRFWVRDNGQGLDDQARERLFAIFNRTSTTRTTGHGLGLSIARRIVEKLGGVVGVESEGPGEGSLFYFTLPAVEENTSPAGTTD